MEIDAEGLLFQNRDPENPFIFTASFTNQVVWLLL
jgi:hypothetical protein